MTAAERLAQIEARANAATKGPWQSERRALGTRALHKVTSEPLVEGRDRFLVAEQVLGRDVEFIAHARQDVPALVAALRAVLAEADAHDILAEQSDDLSFDPTHSGLATAHRLAARGIRSAITEHLGGAS